MFGRLKEQPSPQSLVGAGYAASPAAPEADAPRGPPERLILIVFMVATVLASALVLHNAALDQKNDPVQKAARGDIKGLDPLSFLRPERLRMAVAKVEATRWPLIISLRVQATRVDIASRDKNGFRKFIDVNPALKLRIDDDNVGTDKVFKSPSQIDLTAPQRMINAVTERTHLPASAVDYLVTDAGNTPDSSWYMSLNQGPATARSWVAGHDGTDLRHPGQLSTAQQAADAKRRRDLKAQQLRIERNFKCLATAFTPAAVNRCNRKFPTS